MQNLLDTLFWWHFGQYLWSAIYYTTGLLMIAMPAIIAADLIVNDQHKKVFACATAILAGTVGWLQPGARATAHEHAFVCLRVVSNLGTQLPTAEQIKKCNDFIDYTYEPSSGEGNPTPARKVD